MYSIIPETLDDPGTHALVIGVSRYPYVKDAPEETPFGARSGLGQLSCAAHSAARFAAWLLDTYHNDKAPLSSLPTIPELLFQARSAAFLAFNSLLRFIFGVARTVTSQIQPPR